MGCSYVTFALMNMYWAFLSGKNVVRILKYSNTDCYLQSLKIIVVIAFAYI